LFSPLWEVWLCFCHFASGSGSKPEFSFCIPGCSPIYPQLLPFAIFLAFVPTPGPGACPVGPPPRQKSHNLPHFEAISRTRPRQPPSFVQFFFFAASTGHNDHCILIPATKPPPDI